MGDPGTTFTEVCVIGGGPAGSTVAKRLALLGHDVCLIESATFPRRHIGESLSPGVVPLLKYLDAMTEMESQNVLIPASTLVKWGDSNPVTARTEQMGSSGFVAERGRFDAVLLGTAQNAGVKVLQPARALAPGRVEGGWRIPIDVKDERRTISSRFLVDATGRRSALPGTIRRDGVSTLAMYGYWNHTEFTAGAARVEAGDNEWFWGATLPDGTFNAAVFLDPDRIRTGAGPLSQRYLAEVYINLLQTSQLLAPCLSGQLLGDVVACDASRRCSVSPAGSDFIRVGEASISLDPLSSQGVQAALASGIQAATVVHTILNHPENTDLAVQFYTDRQQESVNRDRTVSSGFYREQAARCPQPFWQKRATEVKPQSSVVINSLPSATTRVQLSSGVEFVSMPVIQENIVCAAKGLRHANLERPVAWLEGCPVETLLEPLETEIEAGLLIDVWSTQLPRHQARRAFLWMWSNGLINSARTPKPLEVFG